MIERVEIDAKATEFGINPFEVQKDYIYGWMLKGIYRHELLAPLCVLKGGGALRKGYFSGSRYSKDLDFSVTTEVDPEKLKLALNNVCSFVTENTGVEFRLDDTQVQPKGAPTGKQVLEAIAYFKSFYGDGRMVLKTQLDVTQFDKCFLPPQTQSLIHPYSDGAACATSIICQKAEEIYASKLVALLHRRRVKDLFDLFYGLMLERNPPVNRLQVITTFLKRSIYDPDPHKGKDDLLAIPIEEARPFWGELVVPVGSGFAFDRVAGSFHQMIEELYGLLPAPVVTSPAYSPDGSSLYRRFPSLGSSTPMQRAAYAKPSSFSFGGSFSVSDRNIIINAGRTRTLLEVGYKGYRRLMEPYKFEYYVRKADNVGSEYLWAFDQSGGESGKKVIKRLFTSEIEYVRPTTQSFAPQWAVEL